MKFSKIHESLIVLCVIFLVFLFWNSPIVYPVKLLSIYFHEMSHSIVTLITGGKVTYVGITSNLGGITNSQGASDSAVLISGYLGSTIFGILTYLFSSKRDFSRVYLVFLSILFLAFSTFMVKNSYGVVAGVIIAVIFFALVFIKNQIFLSILLKIIALINMAYVINDVIHDTFVTVNIYSDAARLEQLTGYSDNIWGILWIAVAVIAFIIILWDLLRGLGK